jgi:putative exosortase-associated protein (TIGR04073 family)
MAAKRWLYLGILVMGLWTLGTEREVQAAARTTVTLEDASPQDVVDGMANKAARGVANVATGWLEFPKQIYITSKEEGYGKGLTVGTLKGVGMTLVRTAAGVGELFTFFVAYPGFYDPFIDPSYAWQKE